MAKLRVHNIEASTGTDVAFGTTGDTIAVSSDSLKLNVWKDSGANTLFQSDGAGTLSNVNAALQGNGPKLIQTQTPSNAAYVEFASNIDNTYDKYQFVFINVRPATDQAYFHFHGSTNAGGPYGVTKTTTFFEDWHNEADNAAGVGYSTSHDLAQSTAAQKISGAQGSGADEGLSGIITMWAPSSTTYIKQFYSRINYYWGGTGSGSIYVGGYFNTTLAIKAYLFAFNSGNIAAGTIKLYGIS